MPKLYRYDFIYFGLLLLELIFTQFPVLYPGHYLSKSLLMPVLLLAWWYQAGRQTIFTKRWMIAALIFSWLGDVLLLFDGASELFFAAGLGSFLVAHLCYAVVFFRQRKKGTPKWLILLLLFFSAGSVYYLIYPQLGPLVVPVTFYMLAILTMAGLASHRHQRSNRKSYLWVLLGALLFVLSDSLIAINKFYHPFFRPALWIMLTYGIGQWLIVRGVADERVSITK